MQPMQQVWYPMHPSTLTFSPPSRPVTPAVVAPVSPTPLTVPSVTSQTQITQAEVQPASDIEEMVKLDPLFTQVLQNQRRQQWGLEHPKVKEFLSKTSMISLGSYCAVANMFESLGLRDAAGPFDWMRSECHGITQLLENGFEDFLECEGSSHKIGSLDVFPLKWGGSFWHHDIRDTKVQETFLRRKERFLKAKNENLLFVRVVNGTQELSYIKALYTALQSQFDSRVRLLVLVDLQDFEQDVGTLDLGPDVIFSCVHHQSWEGPIDAPSPEEEARQRLHKASDAYTKALVRALYVWCNCGSLSATWPSISSFSQHLVPWLGTDPKRDSFQPTRISPRRVATALASMTLNAATLMTHAQPGRVKGSSVIEL